MLHFSSAKNGPQSISDIETGAKVSFMDRIIAYIVAVPKTYTALNEICICTDSRKVNQANTSSIYLLVLLEFGKIFVYRV